MFFNSATFFILLHIYKYQEKSSISLVGTNYFIPVQLKKQKKISNPKGTISEQNEDQQNKDQKEKFQEDVPFLQDHGSEGTLKNSYIAKVLQKIEENKSYPKMELLMEREGMVKVSLTINKLGYIESLEVLEGTSKNFITETIFSIKKSQPFDPIPEELNLNSLSLSLQIKYVLK